MDNRDNTIQEDVQLEPIQSGGMQKTKEEYLHNCEKCKELAKLKSVGKCDMDPRESQRMTVRLAGYQELPFMKGAEKYQLQYYPDAEMEPYSWPAGYILRVKEQEELFQKSEKAEPSKFFNDTKIPSNFTAVAKVFDCLKEELKESKIPSFITYDYDFAATFYRAMGNKRNDQKLWKRKGFDLVQGDHDVCGILLDKNRVVVLFLEVKSRKRTDNAKHPLNELVGKAEDQLKKSERVFKQIVGATAFPRLFLCSLIAFPYLSKRDIAVSLSCTCNCSILTSDDLESRTSFKEFLIKNEVYVTRDGVQHPEAKACYLDVMRTYVAASASVKGMPRTEKDLHESIDERMKRALILLTPHQKMILQYSDRRVLFLAGGQGTGKTYLLLERAQRLAERDEKVIIINMSGGELSSSIKKWRESNEFKLNMKVMDSTDFPDSNKNDLEYFLEKINVYTDSHILIDEMQVIFGISQMSQKNPTQIGLEWKKFSERTKCKSVWIVWRASDAEYRETLDIHGVIGSLGGDKVERLTEIKRNTQPLGEFVVEVTQFIQKRFPCERYLPMQGLEYGWGNKEDPGGENRIPLVVVIPTDSEEYCAYEFASSAVAEIQSSLKNSQLVAIITRKDWERNILVRELRDRFAQNVAFLDLEGKLRGDPNPKFLAFHEHQVTGVSFQDLILLDDGKIFYNSWSRVVGMAQQSLHVVTTDPFPTSHWEEPEHQGLISHDILRKPYQRSKRELGLNTEDAKDIHDLLQHHGLETHKSPDPRVIEALLGKMLKKQKEKKRKLHVAFANAPIHPIGAGQGDTDGLRKEWESIIGSLLSHDSLGSLIIAFQPFVEYATTTFDVQKFKEAFQLTPEKGVSIIVNEVCGDVGFPHLLRHVRQYESPRELKVKYGTLNTRSQPSSLVLGVKPEFIIPPLEAHCHGRFQCIGGRGCVAITAVASLASKPLVRSCLLPFFHFLKLQPQQAFQTQKVK
ncbi:unnamed protein product [Darwinula stevensoni]|uniref:Uncharacterized protein n=1 Tax=Darwinula stevensoni TaxID=69355 RepID=A0A7R9AD86_9CRUS|nr:unnamed protein product [Darwinula stevensoni]CAG0901077.1 unnamed protein product [Darwinula stevensoni]